MSYMPDPLEDWDYDIPRLEAWDSDTSLIGIILGPNGEVLKEIYRPFGYGAAR